MTAPTSKTLRLSIAGQAIEATPPHATNMLPAKLKIASYGRFLLGATRGAASTQPLEVASDATVCLRMEGGFEWWLGAEEACRLFAVGERRDGASAVIELDPRKALRSETARGGDAVDAVLESLEVVGIDLAGMTARMAGEWAENNVLDTRGPGLYRVDLQTDTFAMSCLAETDTFAADGPMLVFIHGTGSSTCGSFGELWDRENRVGKEARAQLQRRYGDAVFALEHRSLTRSPIDNALDLVCRLPPGAEVHLVTHSRGGLVGDLLCLGRRRGDALRAETLDRLFEKDRTLADLWGREGEADNDYPAQRARLAELLAELDRCKPRVARYVRTACPALGTTLASGKLDRWLSVLRFVGGPALQALLAFLLAVVKERTDPRSLPGLEAMMPGSALVRLLNLPELQADADLSVIAGDIEGDSLWSRLKLKLTDWFFVGDHDLVVNTGSMYGGVRRAEGGRYFFDRGPEVCHFRYFRNKATVEHLVFGLLDPAAAGAAFKPLADAMRVEPARSARKRARQAADAPIAIILPGIMGSHLTAGGAHVWFDLKRMAAGGIEEIGIERADVKPSEVFQHYYGDFIEFLGASHAVSVLPYDWRLSVLDSAAELARLVEDRLTEAERDRRGLHIVAHSMGGLVARAMLAQRPDLWRRLKGLSAPGRFRLLMLGTPNRGSFQAMRLMVGQHFLTNMLALADSHHSLFEMLGIINRFPGAAELLPWLRDNDDFANPKFWANLKGETDELWPLPDTAALAAARKTWEQLRDAPTDRECMAYVAGGAKQTAIAYRIEQGANPYLPHDRHIVFYSTRRGDGTVPWDHGRLAGVDTWYAEGVAHDRLLAHLPYFPAYLDLLLNGATDRLPNVEPAGVRGLAAAEDLHPMPPDLPPYQPTEADFGGFGDGFANPRAERSDASVCAALPPTQISVCHGDLAYARHPVCVGHYQGDTQVSAERRLDDTLNGALSARLRLDIYPGRIGTWEIFVAPDANTHPGGALVIGLGQVGALTPDALAAAMSRMLLDYALQVANWHDNRFGAADSIRRARISTLLIGTGAGGFTVRDSVTAILRAVKTAKERLAALSPSPRVCIDAIEIMEVYADIAVQAAHALEDALAAQELAEGFFWSDAMVRPGISGLERATLDETPGWWRRIEIAYDREREYLRFALLTESRARAELLLSRGQICLADDFVAGVSKTTHGDGELSRTLYEMLYPNALKELAPERRDTVLLVDEESARFPWEMLDDRWTDAGPLAIAAGLLRQLKTTEFRPAPLQTKESNALVIGTPLIGDANNFPDLPGARSEAEGVATCLRDAGYRVVQTIDADHMAVLRGLHGGAYRILHLAGHGVHEEETAGAPETCDSCAQVLPRPPRRRSGMVIGDGKILTPNDIRQLRWVPELVFINCCHLGKTQSKHSPPYGRLAANLAVEFIRMGVKAVVAAGWAVDDAAARSFATGFYAAMARGLPFGQAIWETRRQVRSSHPNCNTWGAYQCYGDPHYRLLDDATAKPMAGRLYRATRELAIDLENLAARARTNTVPPAEIDGLLNRIPPKHKNDWLADGTIATALGMAYGELRRFEEAVSHLDSAARHDHAAISLEALELRANYRTRLALDLGLAGKITEANEMFATAEKELKQLLAIGETIERHNLLGSLWKRRTLVASGEDRLEALDNMKRHYGEATKLGARDTAKNSYAKINELLAELFLLHCSPKPKRKSNKATTPAAIADTCLKIADDCHIANRLNPDLWVALDEANARLVAALSKQSLKEEKQELIALYRHALIRGASQAEADSLTDQIRFINSHLSHLSKLSAMREAMIDIQRTLESVVKLRSK